jgi:hypothetical protein
VARECHCAMVWILVRILVRVVVISVRIVFRGMVRLLVGKRSEVICGVGCCELTRYGGASWRVGLGEKRWVFLGKVKVVEEVLQDKDFECL